MFVVQTASHADRVSDPFNIVELGPDRRVIRVFDVDDEVARPAAATRS